MNVTIRSMLDTLYSQDREAQTQAYYDLLSAVDQPVNWIYEAWDELVAGLTHKDNHVRSISAQVLCGLARHDPEARILKDFDILLAVTKDERFVTARHCLQAIWKVGLGGAQQRQRLVDGLTGRFSQCISEKNCTLIRYDILQSLRNLYDQTQDQTIRQRALSLIETETDEKYRKKYSDLWKK